MIRLSAPCFATAEAAAGSKNYIGQWGEVLLFATEGTGLAGAVPVEENKWRQATYDEMARAVSEILQSIREDSE